MNTLPEEILSNIIQRLPLQQKYQLKTVSKSFEEASNVALKKSRLWISTVKDVCSVKKGILDNISSLKYLRSLTIDNRDVLDYQDPLTQQELSDFVDRNTVDGQLRFSLTLFQDQDYPFQENTQCITDHSVPLPYTRTIWTTNWRGMEWVWSEIHPQNLHFL